MGMILQRTLDEDCHLGIWRIIEDFDSLNAVVKLSDEEREILNGFQSHHRKLEWLSVRVLINELLKKDCLITYNNDHKPFLHDSSHNISISHSRELTSILVSKKKKVGIDLEFMSHQINNIAHKFINEKEIITADESLRRAHLYIHWCAKEALYKICDKQDINFKQNLTIEPFTIAESGSFKGYVNNRFGHDVFTLNYFEIDNYIVVWCAK
jgi:4'-phosphopantetheinyl transferase